MQQFSFTIRLDRVPSDQEADALYEAGLDDGNIVDGNGRAAIMITREAKSLDEAILSSVADIRKAGFEAIGVVNEDLVTIPVIARRTGRSHESVRLLAAGKRGGGGFPIPVTGNLYSWAEVRRWFSKLNGVVAGGDYEADTLAAADLFLRARLLRPDAGRLTELVVDQAQ